MEQRLKLMACEMIESCIQRTETAFQQWLKKSVTFISTDYTLPSEICAMVNVILDAKNQSFKLCTIDGIDVVSYHCPLPSCGPFTIHIFPSSSTNTTQRWTTR